MKTQYPDNQVMTCGDIAASGLQALLARYEMVLVFVEDDMAIPGSYWGDEEAGIIGNQLLVRSDTPVHSALHEACHFICMDEQRRSGLHTDAGGGYDEENGVCFLQIMLADYIPEMGRDRMMADMDAWGYSFRLGSSRAWFEGDAEDAREWLRVNKLITAGNEPAWHLRR